MSQSEHTIIKAIIGLGNPGRKYQHNRHNIGFCIVDALGKRFGASWKMNDAMEYAEIVINNHPIKLIKPQTFMNASGNVVPVLQKQGIKAENILVVHDELELPFGSIKIKKGGSAKGHNGLKSIMEQTGQDFYRLRFGIGRPENKEQVPDYVLQNFKESPSEIAMLIEQAVDMITDMLQ